MGWKENSMWLFFSFCYGESFLNCLLEQEIKCQEIKRAQAPLFPPARIHFLSRDAVFTQPMKSAWRLQECPWLPERGRRGKPKEKAKDPYLVETYPRLWEKPGYLKIPTSKTEVQASYHKWVGSEWASEDVRHQGLEEGSEQPRDISWVKEGLMSWHEFIKTSCPRRMTS